MHGRLAILCAAALSLAGCVGTPKSCRGLGMPLPVAPRPEQASVAQLQCGADLNIVAAQVQLARRYEAGDGVQRDLKRAVALYERAAIAIPPTTAIYSPPVSLGGRGQMMFFNNPNAGPGSAEAQYQLGRLLLAGQGIVQDVKRGRKLLEKAAQQGYAPAMILLSQSIRE